MTLEERVDRVERQNRRLKLSLAAFLALAVCGFSGGAMLQQNKVFKADRIEAKHFVLTDQAQSQHAVGEWYVAGTGANFMMNDFDGRNQVKFQTSRFKE